ncbi:MAG: hypothetical protein RL419_49, partial [Actinomycetota bacterium]
MSRHPTPPHRREHVDVEANTVANEPTFDSSPCALLAVDVSKTYGDAPALNPVSLRIETGDRVALIGHNGSGKTTFLKMSAGLLDPSSGHVSINGNKAGSLGARADVSYISDQPTFYDDL